VVSERVAARRQAPALRAIPVGPALDAGRRSPGSVGFSDGVAAPRQTSALRATLVGPELEAGGRSRRGQILGRGCRAAIVRRGHGKPSADPTENAREFVLPAYCHASGHFGSRRIERTGRSGGALPLRRGASRPGNDPKVSGSSKKSRIRIPEDRTGQGSRRVDRHGILPETRFR
jgi:hypothetical protein